MPPAPRSERSDRQLRRRLGRPRPARLQPPGRCHRRQRPPRRRDTSAPAPRLGPVPPPPTAPQRAPATGAAPKREPRVRAERSARQAQNQRQRNPNLRPQAQPDRICRITQDPVVSRSQAAISQPIGQHAAPGRDCATLQHVKGVRTTLTAHVYSQTRPCNASSTARHRRTASFYRNRLAKTGQPSRLIAVRTTRDCEIFVFCAKSMCVGQQSA